MRRNMKMEKLKRQRMDRPRWFELKVRQKVGQPQNYIEIVNGATLLVALCWRRDYYWFVKADNGVVTSSIIYPSHAIAMSHWRNRCVRWEGE